MLSQVSRRNSSTISNVFKVFLELIFAYNCITVAQLPIVYFHLVDKLVVFGSRTKFLATKISSPLYRFSLLWSVKESRPIANLCLLQLMRELAVTGCRWK